MTGAGYHRSGLLMTKPPLTPAERRCEAERLIDLARGLLNDPDEEMVVNYLDHAIEALHIVAERETSSSE
jgi:hypothetical protein